MKLLGLEISFGQQPEEPRFLGDMVRLKLEPGDVCVLMVPGRISNETAERMREMWTTAIGEAVTLLVLDSGMRIGVLSPSQAAAAAVQIADGRAIATAVSGEG